MCVTRINLDEGRLAELLRGKTTFVFHIAKGDTEVLQEELHAEVLSALSQIKKVPAYTKFPEKDSTK